jgi:hypothetical protein
MRLLINILFPIIYVLLGSYKILANPIIIHFINELKFDSTEWILELRNNGTDIGFTEQLSLDGCYLISTTDTSFFKNGMVLDSNYLVITENSLQTHFKINPDGDVISLFLADSSEFDKLSFGNSCVNAFRCPPAPNEEQSISIIDDCYYLDNTPTLGQPNDTLNSMGFVLCKVTDSSGIALQDVNVCAEPLYISDYQKFFKYAKTGNNGIYSVNVLSAWVSLFHWKDNYQSNSIYLQVFPESTITTNLSLELIQSVFEMNSPSILHDYELHFNYPNPFNNTTTIVYKIPIDDFIEINIFNMKGQHIKNLYLGFQQAGQHRISWNAKNIPSGIYIYQMKSANIALSKKCLLVK